METDQIKARTRCCCCGSPMEESKNVTFVTLEVRAEWEYPIGGNVLLGEGGEAVAVVCDACVEKKADIEYAVEFRGDEVFYHEVAWLEAI